MKGQSLGHKISTSNTTRVYFVLEIEEKKLYINKREKVNLPSAQ